MVRLLLKVNRSTVIVCYRPNRWDEWISFESPRISPFRTRTQHTTAHIHASPSPTIPVSTAPVTGKNDIRVLLPEVVNVCHKIMPMLDAAAAFSKEVG